MLAVVLFDGTCNFCDTAVHFIIDHERAPSLRFAALQSDAAAELLESALGDAAAGRIRQGADGSGAPDTMVFVEGGQATSRSTAALAIARHLRAPWRWLTIFRFVPRPIRDAFYRFFARHRYRWFGRVEACRVPTPELRERFLG